ncbi:MAG: hypothetical protein ACU0GG_21460 [Paracoccaceae bacterium]
MVFQANVPDFLPVEWMEGMTGLADRSGPAFFAIFCMVIAVFLLRTENRKTVIAGYMCFLLSAGIIASITLISAASRTHRYDFRIFDLASSAEEIDQGLGYRVEASEAEDIWLKSRNSVNQIYVLALREEPFTPGDTIELLVRDGRSLELTVHSVGFCDAPRNPLYELRKIEGASEGRDDLQITGHEECGPSTVSGWPMFGAAFAADGDRKIPDLDALATAPITLRYYDKTADGTRVEDAVTAVTQTPGQKLRAFSELSRSPDQGSNAVWFGAAVPPDVAAEVAIELIENGVPLTYFGPYVFGTTRINTVEVGYSANEAGNTPLTIDDVRATVDRLSQE